MNPNSQRNAKHGPVIMPVEPPYEFLRWMACNPIIFAASDEVVTLTQYTKMREAMKTALARKRMRK